jgi:hypothetical protein
MDIQSCTAFDGIRCVSSGSLVEVIKKVKKIIDQGEPKSILIFDDCSSELIEVDFRGTIKKILQRLEAQTNPAFPNQEMDKQLGPGRPKLGVVSREVSLLPRHWDWLHAQPGGASVALRKLVEEARRVHRGRDKVRRAQEVSYRFMSAMAGNMPGFEEASRALFAGKSDPFGLLIDSWPTDIRDHVHKISAAAFQR